MPSVDNVPLSATDHEVLSGQRERDAGSTRGPGASTIESEVVLPISTEEEVDHAGAGTARDSFERYSVIREV